MRHLLVKKNFQLFYCFHVAALLFISARPILGHFLPIFLWFLIKTARNRKFFAQNCDFLSFWILLYLSGSKFCPGGNFQFSANFGRFS